MVFAQAAAMVTACGPTSTVVPPIAFGDLVEEVDFSGTYVMAGADGAELGPVWISHMADGVDFVILGNDSSDRMCGDMFWLRFPGSDLLALFRPCGEESAYYFLANRTDDGFDLREIVPKYPEMFAGAARRFGLDDTSGGGNLSATPSALALRHFLADGDFDTYATVRPLYRLVRNENIGAPPELPAEPPALPTFTFDRLAGMVNFAQAAQPATAD